MGAFDGFTVGSRLILLRNAYGFADAGTQVEVVAVLQPGDADGAIRLADDGIRVKRADGADHGMCEFIGAYGRKYFE